MIQCHCGAPATHHHHIFPRNSFPQFEDLKANPWNGLWVCEPCHLKIHGKGKSLTNTIHPEFSNYSAREFWGKHGRYLIIRNENGDVYYVHDLNIVADIKELNGIPFTTNFDEIRSTKRFKADSRSSNGFRSITKYYKVDQQ